MARSGNSFWNEKSLKKYESKYSLMCSMQCEHFSVCCYSPLFTTPYSTVTEVFAFVESKLRSFEGKSILESKLEVFRQMTLKIQIVWNATVVGLVNSYQRPFSSAWQVWRWRWRHLDLWKFSKYLGVDRT
jgi:hypothetical protein